MREFLPMIFISCDHTHNLNKNVKNSMHLRCIDLPFTNLHVKQKLYYFAIFSTA